MNLEVVGHRVLVKPEHVAAETDWGFKMDVGDTYKREMGATQIGTIVGIGPNAWLDFKPGNRWAEVGDKIYYAKYAGKTVKPSEDEEYVIINDEDVQCIIREEVDENE